MATNTTSFKVPKSVPKSIQTIDRFLGVDFTNSPAHIDIYRTPNGRNMIRDIPGKVRKSLGWEVVKRYDGECINGYHALLGDDDYIIHAGTKIYHDDTVVYDGANNRRSTSWQFGEKLYIIDGKKVLVAYKSEGTWVCKSIEEEAYIPTVTISKNPDGGGTPYEPLNLLSAGFTEQFLGKANVKEYALSFSGLDSKEVSVQLMTSAAEWVTKKENVDFTVNRTTGVITFTTAPGVSPVTGEDNIKITAYRTVSGYADRINHCTIGTLYGVNSAMDRLFLSGNDEYPNYDWFSEQYDPTYFPDTSYSRLGSDGSHIIGYSLVGSYLATHKDDLEKYQTVFLRSGATLEDKVYFKVVNSLQGAGAVSAHAFGYMETEPLFLTKQGVFAITTQDLNGERYAQNRSFYINGKLLEEPHLEDAYAVVFHDMYWIAINGVCYILDGLQAARTDDQMPYSTRQYCGFYRENVPAHVMWVKDDTLWFGSQDGRVCRFKKDKFNHDSYNDDGEPIVAVWETPDLDGRIFFKNKTLRYLAIRLVSDISTSVNIYTMDRGLWEFVKTDDTTGLTFRFSNIKFSKFTFSCDDTQKTIRTKLRVKKVDKFRIRLSNDKLDEPFGLYDMGLEFVENGNFKG